MIPGESEAIIPDGKMDYVLAIDKDKARLFKSALGYVDGDQQTLKEEILKKVKSGEYVCEKQDLTEYGQKYKMHVILYGKDGKKADTRIGWIKTSDKLQLVTIFPEDRKGEKK